MVAVEEARIVINQYIGNSLNTHSESLSFPLVRIATIVAAAYVLLMQLHQHLALQLQQQLEHIIVRSVRNPIVDAPETAVVALQTVQLADEGSEGGE